MVYDDLIEHLAATHEVIEFAYDWRRPVEDEARRLGQVVEAALARRDASGQPVRLLAHSMGGLVARTMQLECPQVWQRLMARDGARLLMLGTPNGGSWAPMQVLSGDDTFGNTLVAFGGLFDDAGTREVMAAMPGFIQLQAALTDPALALDRAATWQQLADDDLRRLRERSRWHHRRAAARRLPLERAAAGRARPRRGAAQAARRAGRGAGRRCAARCCSSSAATASRRPATDSATRASSTSTPPMAATAACRWPARCCPACAPGAAMSRTASCPTHRRRLRRLCRVAGQRRHAAPAAPGADRRRHARRPGAATERRCWCRTGRRAAGATRRRRRCPASSMRAAARPGPRVPAPAPAWLGVRAQRQPEVRQRAADGRPLRVGAAQRYRSTWSTG